MNQTHSFPDVLFFCLASLYVYLVGSDMVRQIQKAIIDVSPGEALLQGVTFTHAGPCQPLHPLLLTILSLSEGKARQEPVPDPVTKVLIQKFIPGGLQAHGNWQELLAALGIWKPVLHIALVFSFKKARDQPSICFCSENYNKLLAVPGCF